MRVVFFIQMIPLMGGRNFTVNGTSRRSLRSVLGTTVRWSRPFDVDNNEDVVEGHAVEMLGYDYKKGEALYAPPSSRYEILSTKNRKP